MNCRIAALTGFLLRRALPTIHSRTSTVLFQAQIMIAYPFRYWISKAEALVR